MKCHTSNSADVTHGIETKMCHQKKKTDECVSIVLSLSLVEMCSSTLIRISYIIIFICEILEYPIKVSSLAIDQRRRRILAATIASSSAAVVPMVPAFLPNASAVATASDIVIPGVAGTAPLRNTIVDESETNGGISWSPQEALVTKLAKNRILVQQLSPLNPSLIPFANDNELFYDFQFLGGWKVTCTLKRKIFPYGTDYLPSSSLYEGSPRYRNENPGDSTTYQVNFFEDSTGKVRADRAFNAKSLNTAYKQLSKVEDIQWNYQRDPTRLTIMFSSLSEDFEPLGTRRGEIYITARNSERGVSSLGEKVFCTAERMRSVILVPGNVVVSGTWSTLIVLQKKHVDANIYSFLFILISFYMYPFLQNIQDTETITEYRFIEGTNGNKIKAICRIAVYLTPNPNSREGILWQEVNGKAVGFYDYELDMERIIETTGENVGKSCVIIPDNSVQCYT